MGCQCGHVRVDAQEVVVEHAGDGATHGFIGRAHVVADRAMYRSQLQTAESVEAVPDAGKCAVKHTERFLGGDELGSISQERGRGAGQSKQVGWLTDLLGQALPTPTPIGFDGESLLWSKAAGGELLFECTHSGA